MKKTKSIITLIGSALLLFSCGKNANAQGAITGKVKIGTQTWAITNLNVITFNNGDTIPEAKTKEAWNKAGTDGKPAWCYYNNDKNNGPKYGKLYNWYAVNDQRGLAPNGWHVPSLGDWYLLIRHLAGQVEGNDAGTKMKSTRNWAMCNGGYGNGTNTSGFAGFPGGNRGNGGTFNFIGHMGSWWTSSSSSTESPIAWYLYLSCGDGTAWTYPGYNQSYGLSVRCIHN